MEERVVLEGLTELALLVEQSRQRRHRGGVLEKFCRVGPSGFGECCDEFFLRVKNPYEDLEVLGMDFMEFGGDRSAHPWTYEYLWGWIFSISGGTSEIQREITADRVLGLPRSR